MIESSPWSEKRFVPFCRRASISSIYFSPRFWNQISHNTKISPCTDAHRADVEWTTMFHPLTVFDKATVAIESSGSSQEQPGASQQLVFGRFSFLNILSDSSTDVTEVEQ